MNVRLADEAVLYFDRSILNPDRGLALFRSSKGELERGIESVRLVGLEDVGHEVEQPSHRAHSQTIAYGLQCLVFEFPPCNGFGVRARDYINWLGAFLQGFHYFQEVAL